MQVKISNRMASMKPSLVREILKASADPQVIAFSAGNPAPNAFPVEDIGEITAEIFREHPIDALQYSITEGYLALRERTKALCASHYGTPVEEDEDLMILSGAQQGADLTAKVLVNEGDVVLCEDPSFIGCLNCFRSYGCQLVGVELEEDGVNLEKLEEAMKLPNVKLFYVIPNFQNPTGITTSLEKRRGILELARKHHVMILEDNPYGDLRYSGEPLPSIKSMDREGNVIYMGSFSKVIAPGLRVGFAIAQKDILAKMIVGKQCADVHTSILPQMICERFLATRDFSAHLAGLQKIYREKLNLMLEHMDREFAPEISWTKPQGGLFVWCTLPRGVDMQGFCKRAVEQKVAVVPGIAFTADPDGACQSFRLNFSTPTDKAIIEGIQRLGALTKQL